MGYEVELCHEFIEKHALEVRNLQVQPLGVVWDTNLVKISLFTVKDFTFILSTRRQDASLLPIASDWRPGCHRSDGEFTNPCL